MTQERLWQISEARANLSNVMEGALSGTPQVIKKRTGEEVVVIAREDYKRLKPTLRDYLLQSAGLDSDQVLDEGIRQARSTGTLGLTVRAQVEEK
ncbi:type II toxin-antitoxin system prevent-host-death family antitoxin [Skermanella pratensis]|uniref:type II toxin-antitoxin system prevent-host-death family antitoxin n=1 Tax=Skermanella pratensis TaxID=2233999 RepID=UPI0017882054|nr:type II toxin-antitoxin system prevent-host-death family antitoxin [Skermanella pratensis]